MPFGLELIQVSMVRISSGVHVPCGSLGIWGFNRNCHLVFDLVEQVLLSFGDEDQIGGVIKACCFALSLC